MLKKKEKTPQLNNSGFTLVELIIVVAILAIATIPIMKAFSNSAIINSKSMSRQNATSLAEDMMENVKAYTIEELKALYGTDMTEKTISGTSHKYYEISLADQPSRQGEKFDVKIKITPEGYMTAEDETASDANSKKLPSIDKIDTTQMTVLSSKELNKYDEAAKDYFDEYSTTASGKSVRNVSKKLIKIDKSNEAGSVKVKCTVTYECAQNSELKYEREVFSGSYSPKTSGEISENAIYIFYKRYPTTPSISENITITDKTGSKSKHKVYLIMQDAAISGGYDLSGTTVTINNGSEDVIYADSDDDLIMTDENGDDVYGRKTSDDGEYELTTNIEDINNKGHIYDEAARERIYEITVTLTEPGNADNVIATLTSTKNVSPTPTP